jgi:hypothetical protein
MITRDMWQMTYELMRDIKPDASNFCESDAWPQIHIDFIDWFRRRTISEQLRS